MDADHEGHPSDTGPFADPARYAALPRLTGLALSPDGSRLVACVQQPDSKGARYVSCLWQIPLQGGEPVRLTRSERGEASPAFLPGGELLFVSARPNGSDGAGDGTADDDAALWLLPASGEARVIARSPGGVGSPVVAADSGTVVVSGSRLAWTAPDGDDGARRKTRAERRVSAILHTGMPIRHWDHELGEESPRLLALGGDRELRDLTPHAGQALHETSCSITADGTTIVTSWRSRRRGGRFDRVLVGIDVASGEHTVLADEDGIDYVAPVISPDGTMIAVGRNFGGDYERLLAESVQLRRADGSREPVLADLGDVFPHEWAFSRDSRTLYVAGDLHGRGAVVAVDAATGAATQLLAVDASYSCLSPSPDGRYVYALRSAVDCAPTPVRLDTRLEAQVPHRLPTPALTPPLPGTLVEIETTAPDGTTLHGWLCLPPAGEQPCPVMLWVHGGPFSSWNAWSWRWNPWVAVARGYAVLLPDPALSTGYGQGFLERAWPHRAGIVWRDLETVLEDVLDRFELDRDRVACLGASFGGYMTNWIAGHTDRFGAIVTHAGLWALDQQHTTTDGAQWKTGIFGTPAEHPDWYAENSPHNFVDKIGTPMLIVHGNRDYRVPISEALRLWWDLVSRHDGTPETMPHRFLQLTGENHWVLSPANAQLWYDTVLGFCDQHVLGRQWRPSTLL
jgi:dipeptidyl aminopeptidase/acylaminoacyl peptidase